MIPVRNTWNMSTIELWLVNKLEWSCPAYIQLHYNATLYISAYNRLKQRLPVYRQNFNSHTTSPGPKAINFKESPYWETIPGTSLVRNIKTQREIQLRFRKQQSLKFKGPPHGETNPRGWVCEGRLKIIIRIACT